MNKTKHKNKSRKPWGWCPLYEVSSNMHHYQNVRVDGPLYTYLLTPAARSPSKLFYYPYNILPYECSEDARPLLKIRGTPKCLQASLVAMDPLPQATIPPICPHTDPLTKLKCL